MESVASKRRRECDDEDAQFVHLFRHCFHAFAWVHFVATPDETVANAMLVHDYVFKLCTLGRGNFVFDTVVALLRYGRCFYTELSPRAFLGNISTDQDFPASVRSPVLHCYAFFKKRLQNRDLAAYIVWQAFSGNNDVTIMMQNRANASVFRMAGYMQRQWIPYVRNFMAQSDKPWNDELLQQIRMNSGD